MGRPTLVTGWWKLVLDQKAAGRVDLLANLCGVSVRTIHRWVSGNIKVPDFEKRRAIRLVAGKELIAHNECPVALRLKKKTLA